MAFQKTVEDFVCEHCGQKVAGTGYTNHCPKCLWSKHVDIDPGDRKEACLGMMEPVGIEGTTDAYRVIHRCLKCGVERKNTVSSEDDMNAVIAIVAKKAAQK